MRIFAYATQKGGVEKWLVLLKRKAIKRRNKQLDTLFVEKEKAAYSHIRPFTLTF